MHKIFTCLARASMLSSSILVLIFLSIYFDATAQPSTITFKIINTKNEAVPFASLKAVSVLDTTNTQQKVSDSSGIASLSLNKGQYTVLVTSINYNPVEKRITIAASNPIFTITVTPLLNALNNVVVTSTRPLIRQEDDKTIVDPENLAASSTNAFEILEKVPGLYVDQDGNVYLSSTTPAAIHINGREQKMSTSDVATMLKSLPPNSIEKIEILRTPSARYDASGGGGIVNVVLKKGVRIGLTGSVNTGFNQGRYGNRFAGINLNNNDGKLTTTLNIQYSRRNSYDQIKTDRKFASDTILNQDAFTNYPANTFYTGFGIGYQFTPKLEMNYDGRISINNFENSTVNNSDILKISTGTTLTRNTANVVNTGRSIGLSQSISGKYKIDTSGSEWTMDLSYTGTPNNSNQDFTTTYNFPSRAATGGDGDIKTRLNYFSGNTNLLLKLPAKITIETGLKSTFTNFTNAADYFRQANNLRTKDAFRTAAFRYNENINSGYLQASRNFSGIILKVGTRVENTNMQGNQQVPKDTSFNIHRTDFFPYVYLSRTLMKIAGYELKGYLVYRRTISRPSYDLLNPFPRYIDQYLFETGNPTLRPQFTKNYEANISVDERPIFALGFNDTKDIFTQVIYQADTSKSLAYKTYDNLGSNKETYFRILGAIPPGKKYFVVAGAQYNHNFYNGLYENKPLSFKRGSWSIFTYQTFKVTKTTQLTLNGFARFNGQLQFYELSTFGALNFSVVQQFLNKKLIVSLSANDILFTNNNTFSIQQGTVNASGFRKSDTRRVGLNVRYNFGFRKKEENNMFNIESPDKLN